MSAEWNGEGRPPVGCECEVQYWNDGLREKVRIIAWHGNDVWVEFTECKWKTSIISNPDFRPIRDEAERKRQEAGLAIYHAINWNAEGGLVSPSRMEDYMKAFDAIAAGKIPHITLK